MATLSYFDISYLRLAAIAGGAVFILIAIYNLRTAHTVRSVIWLLFFFGGGLTLVGLFPTLLDMPTELINFRRFPGGRTLTLLIFAVSVLTILLLNERGKVERHEEHLDLLTRKFATSSFWADENNKETANRAKDGIIVIIPAFNEEENLHVVIPRIPRTIGDNKVLTLVVDDGSDDETARIAREKGALVISQPFNRGGGAALRTGFDIASDIGAKIIVTMDADGQHKPEEIETLVKPILDGEADIIIGSRVIGSREKDSAVRWVGIHVFNTMINVLLGITISDCSSGFRAFSTDLVKSLKLAQNQYHTAEFIIDAAKRGAKIDERPIHIAKRLTGKSKKGTNLFYGFSFFRTVVKTWLR